MRTRDIALVAACAGFLPALVRAQEAPPPAGTAAAATATTADAPSAAAATATAESAPAPAAAAPAPVLDAVRRVPSPPAPPDDTMHLQEPFLFRFQNGVSLKLYGKLELLAYFDTTTPYISDWLAWVEPKGTINGDEDSFSMSVRGSPIGVHVNWPRILGGAALNARIEFDFVGGFVTGGSAAYSPLMRLKQAWVSLDGKHVTLLAGQHFGIFAPLFPDTANWIALGTSGNPWIRLPQVRLTVRGAGLQWDLSANRPMGSNEVLTDTVNDHVSDGEWSNIPFFMTRLGGQHRLAKDVSLGWGVSGVWGREKVKRYLDPATGKVVDRKDGAPKEGNELRSKEVDLWMANVDLKLVTKYVEVMGEFFGGANVNTFFAGVLQGVAITGTKATETTPAGFNVRSIRTIGGWGQITGKPSADWRLYAGAGIDHPYDEDLLPIYNPKAPPRLYNLSAYGAVHYAIGGAWRVGVEVSYTRTQYLKDCGNNYNLRTLARSSLSF